jgi:sporulation protein YlmC with PRC-barrel domain
MLRNERDILGYGVSGSDGEIGTLQQCLFDDETWTVRYLQVRTGNWFLHQQVFVSPIAVNAIIDERRSICIQQKKSLIANAPQARPNLPIPRRFEEKFSSYYGWPVYWGQAGRWGAEQSPSRLFNVAPINEAPSPYAESSRDTNLRSTAELRMFSVSGTDGRLGRVRDFIIDDDTWAVRYVVIAPDEAGSAPMLASPHWIAEVSLGENMIIVDAAAAAVRAAPAYRGTSAVTRDYELQLFRHYGRLDEIDAVRVRQRVAL